MHIPPALRHRRYALWWSGTLVSITGSQMQLWTLFWHLRGRVSSLNQIFMMGGPQLGEVEAGLAAQAFGVAGSIVLGGLGALTAVAWIALRWPELRRYSHEGAAQETG